jgi:hypothetical protein
MKEGGMEGFIPQQEQHKDILNDWDKRILMEGGKGVLNKILEKFDGNLPDVVIYPDASARPLFYLLDSSFKKLSQEKGIALPQTYFFAVHRSDSKTYWLQEERASSGDTRKVELADVETFIKEGTAEMKKRERETEQEEGFRIYSDEQLEEMEKQDLREADDTFVKRHIEGLRANEIKEYIKKSGIAEPKIVVIDDFYHEGKTQYEINEAFGMEVPYLSLYTVPFTGGYDKAGIEIENDDNNPSTGSATKLTYSGTYSGVGRKSIGVTKDDFKRYATVNRNKDGFTEEDHFDVVELRKEMKELGENLAVSL